LSLDIVSKKHENFSLWSLVSPEWIRFRSWADDDSSVVYNALTGDTHLVDALGFELLQLLTVAPYTHEALLLKLGELFCDDDKTMLNDYIGTTLLQLHNAGLICESLF
jgi:PqqD family protein of HPr-rel-A system